MNQIKAVTLDLDDTLWEIEPVIRNAEAALWQWLDMHYPRIVERWTPESVFELRVEVMQQHADRAHDFRFLRKRVLGHIAQDAGYSHDMVEPAFAVFDEQRNRVELFPEVLTELEILSKHFRLLAVTNGNANLHKIGIANFFAAIITAEGIGAAKPSPTIFNEAIRLAGVQPEEILHVGDHPDTDVEGAKLAGMRTAWVNRKDHAWPDHLDAPDATVTDMSEVRELLEPAISGFGRR